MASVPSCLKGTLSSWPQAPQGPESPFQVPLEQTLEAPSVFAFWQMFLFPLVLKYQFCWIFRSKLIVIFSQHFPRTLVIMLGPRR